MDKPLISVLMTLYNHENFVADAINSVLDQTYDNWELLIVNDCSTDNSEKVVQSFNDKRIRYYKNEQNKGTIISLNSIIKKAKGEYIAILDSDDMWTKEKLNKQLCFMQKHIRYYATFTQADIVDINGKPYPKNRNADIGKNIYMQDNLNREDLLRRFFYKGNCLAHPSLVVKKEVFKNVGMHDLRFRQLHDLEFYTRLLLKYDACIIQEPLLNVRRIKKNNDSVSAQSMDNARRSRNETSLLIYNMINDMPKNLFIKVFNDKINKRIKDQQDLICEKYFLLKKWKMDTVNNLLPAMTFMAQHIRDEKVLNKLNKKYNYSIKDYYKDTGKVIQLYRPYYYPEIEKEMNKIYHSTSWIITKPLRFAKWIFIRDKQE